MGASQEMSDFITAALQQVLRWAIDDGWNHIGFHLRSPWKGWGLGHASGRSALQKFDPCNAFSPLLDLAVSPSALHLSSLMRNTCKGTLRVAHIKSTKQLNTKFNPLFPSFCISTLCVCTKTWHGQPNGCTLIKIEMHDLDAMIFFCITT